MGGGHSHSASAYGDRDAIRAVVVSAVALGIASAVEFAASFSGHSVGILADALHNAGDVLTTFVLLASFSLGRRPATRRFPSGFGRIEDVATLVIILIIVITAGAAAVESIRKFFIHEPLVNPLFGLVAAAVGVVANIAVAQYKLRVGRSINSSALMADGVHSRIDALVSAGAGGGIVLTMLGLPIADPIAGLAITGMILFILAGTVRDLFYRMMDAVDPGVVDEITEHAMAVAGVLAVNDVRARWVGRQMAVVMHVACDPALSLREAHDLAVAVEHEVGHAVPAGRLDIHMDAGLDHHHHEVEVGHAHDSDAGHGH